MDDPAEVFSIFTYLVTEARKIKNCFLIVSTLIPSVENQENCDGFFNEFDENLKSLCPPSELLNLNKSFLRSKSGKIIWQLYEDGVHLKESGSKTLAEKVFNVVNRIPKDFFQN